MDVEIRNATTADLAEISRLNLALFEFESVWLPTLNRDWTNSFDGQSYLRYRLTDKKSLVLVALVNKRVVGYLAGGVIDSLKHRTEKSFAVLDNIFLEESVRSKGIGKLLTDRFIAWCAAQQVEVVRVGVLAKNLAAHKFYTQLGFNDNLMNMELKLERSEKS